MKAYLEAEEVRRLERGAGNLRDRLLIRLMFRLGCRVSEALALGVEDIDFNKGTVTIQHLKARIQLSCPQSAQHNYNINLPFEFTLRLIEGNRRHDES